MKKINLLTMLAIMAISIVSFSHASAQKGKGKTYIEAFDEGRVLTQTDIRFLNSITGGGNDSKVAVVYDKKYNAGERLTSNQSALLNKAKSDYRKKHILAKAEDGRAIDRNHYPSSFWYVYNDNASTYYVWYCD